METDEIKELIERHLEFADRVLTLTHEERRLYSDTASALRFLLQEREWKPASEAPTDGTKILVWARYDGYELTEHYTMKRDVYDHVEDDLYRKRTEVSYEGWNSNSFDWWRPLPSPPLRMEE